MPLELVPIDGKVDLTPEQVEQLKRRTRPISDSDLAHFSDQDRAQIKEFLIQLVTLSEISHYDFEHPDQIPNYEEVMQGLLAKRIALFRDPSPGVRRFIDLVEFYPMEPWHEFEVWLGKLHNEERKLYFETKMKTGVQAAADNPFLMAVDQDREEDKKMELDPTKRITPREIADRIHHFSLEDLVRKLVEVRHVLTGQFWDDDHFNL